MRRLVQLPQGAASSTGRRASRKQGEWWIRWKLENSKAWGSESLASHPEDSEGQAK